MKQKLRTFKTDYFTALCAIPFLTKKRQCLLVVVFAMCMIKSVVAVADYEIKK